MFTYKIKNLFDEDEMSVINDERSILEKYGHAIIHYSPCTYSEDQIEPRWPTRTWSLITWVPDREILVKLISADFLRKQGFDRIFPWIDSEEYHGLYDDTEEYGYEILCKILKRKPTDPDPDSNHFTMYGKGKFETEFLDVALEYLIQQFFKHPDIFDQYIGKHIKDAITV